MGDKRSSTGKKIFNATLVIMGLGIALYVLPVIPMVDAVLAFCLAGLVPGTNVMVSADTMLEADVTISVLLLTWVMGRVMWRATHRTLAPTHPLVVASRAVSARRIRLSPFRPIFRAMAGLVDYAYGLTMYAFGLVALGMRVLMSRTWHFSESYLDRLDVWLDYRMNAALLWVASEWRRSEVSQSMSYIISELPRLTHEIQHTPALTRTHHITRSRAR